MTKLALLLSIVCITAACNKRKVIDESNLQDTTTTLSSKKIVGTKASQIITALFNAGIRDKELKISNLNTRADLVECAAEFRNDRKTIEPICFIQDDITILEVKNKADARALFAVINATGIPTTAHEDDNKVKSRRFQIHGVNCNSKISTKAEEQPVHDCVFMYKAAL